MAAKSPTEMIREPQAEVAKLIAELKGLRDEVRSAELLSLRDRLTKLEALLGMLDIPALLRQLGGMQAEIAELRKWREESDRRRFQAAMLFGGSLLTLVIQLVLLFARKP